MHGLTTASDSGQSKQSSCRPPDVELVTVTMIGSMTITRSWPPTTEASSESSRARTTPPGSVTDAVLLSFANRSFAIAFSFRMRDARLRHAAASFSLNDGLVTRTPADASFPHPM
jgi:hypothetical protein